MATRTVSQSGPISLASTFGGSAFSNGDDIVNSAGNNFTLTIDQNATVAGFSGTGGNGQTVVNSGVTLTLTGNSVQGNKKFTLGSGTGNAHLVFDCTAADRKFLFGDAANFTAYANCIFESLGTTGAHNTVSKTGSNYCWFDDFSENSGAGADKTGYDCSYTDFTGIGKADGSFSLAANSFGANDFKFDHCTFTSCGEVLRPRPYGWGGGSNKSYYIRDCSFATSTGTYSCYVRGNSSGSGTKTILRNSFDKTVNINAAHTVEDNLFLRGATILGGTLASNQRNLYRIGSGDSDQSILGSASNCYWLANTNHPGNPHCIGSVPAGSTIAGWIFEYPIAQAIDGGECVYVTAENLTVTNNLAVPSETDGYAIGNMAHYAKSGGGAITTGWSVRHNTVVGRNATIAFSEAGADPNGTLYATLKSNLSVDLSNNDSASILYDLGSATHAWDDLSDPANSTYNGAYEPLSYTDPITSAGYSGYRGRFTSAPGANDIRGNPNFVAPTRNFANWSVSKGAANSGDSLATRTAASITLLKADPTLLHSDLMAWVKAGFAPTNAIYQNAGHDGVTIGAVEGVFGPAAPSGLTATTFSSTRIDLAWTDNSADETGFEIERSLDGSTGWTLIETTAANVESYSDTGLDAETEYFYRVRAVNGSGESAYTSTASDTTDAAPVVTTSLLYSAFSPLRLC